MNLPVRKHPRLKNYDYSQNSAYFVTICTQNRAPLLGSVSVGQGDPTLPHINLSDIGSAAKQFIHGISQAYQNVDVNKYVIMPNHIHMIIVIDAEKHGGVRSPRPTLQTILRAYKSMVTRKLGFSIWQSSFYEHIIRNEEDYLAIWEYIDQNPLKWLYDELYTL